MTPRTLTAPPTDRSMWRRLLRLAHPDGAGAHDLFVWVSALREHVAGDGLGETSPRDRQPPPHPTAGERLDYSAAYDLGGFEDLTAHAVSMADTVGEPYARLLRMLAGCYPAGQADVTGYRSQHHGASGTGSRRASRSLRGTRDT